MSDHDKDKEIELDNVSEDTVSRFDSDLSSPADDVFSEDPLMDSDENTPQLSSENQDGVMIFQGDKYAVGLFWLVSGEEDASGLAKKRAKQADADFYCIRDSVITQHGFGNLKHGHRMGMSVAGVLAADMLVGEWQAVFQTDNGWWYLAVHGDAIAPDGDRFFFDEEDAFAHFKAEADKYKWPRMYAPEDWDVKGVTANLMLDRLLDGSPTNLKAATIDAVFAGKKNKFVALIALLVLMSLVFVISLLPNLILSNVQEAPPVTSMITQNIGEVKAPPKREQIKKTVAGITKMELVRPSAIISACGEAVSRLLRPLPGWDISVVVCNPPTVILRWQQRQGTVDLLMDNLGIFPRGSTARLDGDQFIATLPMADVSNTLSEVSPLKRTDAVLKVNQRLAGAGDLLVDFVQPPAPPAPSSGVGLRQVEAPPPPPPYLNLTFRTRSSPQSIASYFDIEGVEIISVEWQFVSGIWTYKAKVNLDS